MASSSSHLTTLPVTPSSMTSGIDPQRNASTGVPHAMASIMTRPNGSGQSTGNNRAAASPKNFVFSLGDLADELYVRAVDEWQYVVAKVVFINLIDLGGDLQRDAGSPRYADRAVGAFFRRNPPQEGKIASLLKRRPMQVEGNAVADRRNKIRVGYWSPLVVRD